MIEVMTAKSETPASRIKRWRNQVGVLLERGQQGRSGREMGRLSGFSESTWRHLVQGYELKGGLKIPVSPTDRTLAGAALAAGIDLDVLFGAAGREVPDYLRKEQKTKTQDRNAIYDRAMPEYTEDLTPESWEQVRAFMDYVWAQQQLQQEQRR